MGPDGHGGTPPQFQQFKWEKPCDESMINNKYRYTKKYSESMVNTTPSTLRLSSFSRLTDPGDPRSLFWMPSKRGLTCDTTSDLGHLLAPSGAPPE